MQIHRCLIIVPLLGGLVACNRTPEPSKSEAAQTVQNAQPKAPPTGPKPAVPKPDQPVYKIEDDSKLPKQRAPVTVAKGSVLLKLNLKPGSKYVYESTIFKDGSSTKVVATWSVVGRTATGYSVKLIAGSVNASLTIDDFGNAEWTSVSARDGMQTLSLLASAGLLFGFVGIRYPDGPVGPKTVWQDHLNANKIFLMAVNSPDARVSKEGLPLMWTLRNIAKAGGRSVTTIDYQVSGTAQLIPGSFSSNATGTYVVDNETGLPVSIDVEYASSLDYSGSTQSFAARAKTRRIQ